MSRRLIILGGGPCGLYAAVEALRQGLEVTLIEKEKTLGGLAAGHKQGGNTYDFGVHMLHAFDEEVFRTCAKAMGDQRIEVPLKAHIKWAGKTYQYPLRGRDILSGIPPFRLIHCLIGLFVAEARNRISSPRGETAEDALKELYGGALYRIFFEEFTHRYWGLHPRELSAEFVRRKMPRLSAVDVFKNALQVLGLAKPQDQVEGALRFETLHYSRQGAATLPRSLGQYIVKLGGEVLPGDALESITVEGNSVTGVVTASGERRKGDLFLSTVPLSGLCHALPDVPVEVRQSAAQLRTKSMVVFGLLVRKERCMDALYTYYRDRSFHRVGEPKNAGLKVTPAGHTVLIVEKTCDEGDPTWGMADEVLDEIYSDLEAEEICQREDVVECHQLRNRHAYPVFLLGFEQHLEVVNQFLGSFQNLRSTGRQGAFTYPNMHSAMRMGADAVKDLLQN